MIACITMVFGALTEYGIILYFIINEQRADGVSTGIVSPAIYNGDNEQFRSDSAAKDPIENQNLFILSNKTKNFQKPRVYDNAEDDGLNSKNNIQTNMVKRADSISLLMFPSVFFLFTIVYVIMLYH